MTDDERRLVIDILSGFDALMPWRQRFLAEHLPDKDQARYLLEVQRQHVERVRQALGRPGDGGG